MPLHPYFGGDAGVGFVEVKGQDIRQVHGCIYRNKTRSRSSIAIPMAINYRYIIYHKRKCSCNIHVEARFGRSLLCHADGSVIGAQCVVVYIALFMSKTDLVTHKCSIRRPVREVGGRIGEQRAARDIIIGQNQHKRPSNVPFTRDILYIVSL